MFVPPPNGMTHGVRVERGCHDRLDLRLRAGADDDVGQAPEVAGARAHEVAQALAVRVRDALERRGRDARGADRLLERGAELGRELRIGHVEVVDPGRAHLDAVDVEVDVPLTNGARSGLSSCVNAMPSSSPQPHHFC